MGQTSPDRRMRIAHVITRMIIGGAQENTLLTCRGLQEDYGEEVLLITGPSLGPEGSLLDDAQGSGIPLEILPTLRRAIHPWNDWRAYREIRRVLREFQPDVVHTHSAKGGMLGRLAAWRLKVPAIVHTVHGAPLHASQGRGVRAFYRQCETFAARRCHRLVSVARAMTDLMAGAGVAPPEKFVTIYSGMDVEPFLQADQHREAMRRRLGYGQDDIVIGKIARLFHLKGHEFVIEAARRVVAALPRARFLLVGDGILRKQLESQIDRANLSPYFHFAGLVSPQRIPQYIGAMDLLVHTSLREGLAKALPQALIAGRPVISYDVDGAREVVLPATTGILLPPRSVNELADAIIQLGQNATLRRRMGEEGRLRFTDQFRHQRMTRQIHDLYLEILSRAH